jgi:hypothetical protein
MHDLVVEQCAATRIDRACAIAGKRGRLPHRHHRSIVDMSAGVHDSNQRRVVGISYRSRLYRGGRKEIGRGTRSDREHRSEVDYPLIVDQSAQAIDVVGVARGANSGGAVGSRIAKLGRMVETETLRICLVGSVSEDVPDLLSGQRTEAAFVKWKSDRSRILINDACSQELERSDQTRID